MAAPNLGLPGPNNAQNAHGDAEEEIQGTTATGIGPESPETAANPAVNGDFGKEDHEYISGYRMYAALFGIMSVFFLVLLDFSITATAIPYITSDFHRLQDIGWYGSAYVLSSAALQPFTGKLYTYLNVKYTFLFFVFIFEIGSLLCAVSTSSMFFILGRTIAGLGSSALENGALNLVAGAVPLHKRPFYNGIVFAVCQTGIVLGPLIGGALTQYASWRWCFYINLPIGVVSSLFLFFTHVPEETLKPPFSLALLRRIIPELDLTGFALFAPTTVMFLIALHWGSTKHGWSSPVVIGLFAASGATLVIFSIWEWHVGEKSLIPFYLIKRRRVWASAMQSTTLFSLNYVGVNYVPIYFQAVKGVGPSLSGVYMLPSILTQLLSLVISGALVTRIGYYLPFSVISGATTTVACGLISAWNPNTLTAAWIGHQILFGLRGLGLQMSVISVQNAVTPAQSPSAIAFLLFVENLASAVFTVVGNAIFTQTLIRQVSILAPSVSPEAALAVGGSAEAVRGLLPPGSPELHGLLLAFSDSINAVFYLLVALGAVSFAASWGMGWVNVRKKATEQNGTEGVVEGARGSDGIERGPESKCA
ncbi:Efflux pump mokI [Colletotrichum siamense]|uniref:Efflux pump mokI n=1 Tax=Colletotrichum siamense TaxID=690259 RepID=UPI0018728CC7|nr:Efflux pump mokI [Colletotrichum siamense]KAF5489703.1 Efflux pump mokI [Colletotrichum siamense]